MKGLSRFLRVVIVANLACCFANASPFFNFKVAPNSTTGSGTGTALIFNDVNGSGITVTATALYAPDGTTNLAAATPAEYAGNGLGICNPASESSCGTPEHQVDNKDELEFMLFKFSSAVDLNSLVLANFGGAADMDLTYWTRTSSTAPTFTNLSGVVSSGFSAQNNDFCNSCTTLNAQTGVTDSLLTNGTGVSYLLVGAGYGTGNTDGVKDYFKIQSLSAGVSTSVNPAPEPASVQMLALALAGLGLAYRWRGRNHRL